MTKENKLIRKEEKTLKTQTFNIEVVLRAQMFIFKAFTSIF